MICFKTIRDIESNCFNQLYSPKYILNEKKNNSQ